MLRQLVEALLLLLVEAITLSALFIRFLPAILAAARFLIWVCLALSFTLYRSVLTRLSVLTAHVGIDPINTPWRLIATTALSCSISWLIFWLAGWQVTLLAGLLTIVHGLVVGVAWDRLGQPGGLTMGV